jgi:hypothetical protein
VLFSSTEVAKFINDNFEAAWESVRPVPIVTIDFGNGTKMTRTLHGNIATYVCKDDGQVLDVLPGIYEPVEYRKQLDQFRLLWRYAYPSTFGGPTLADRVKDYHNRQAAALKANKPPEVLVMNGGFSKGRIENPVKLMVAGAQPAASAQAPELPKTSTAAEQIAGWKVLAEDTQLNESVRRLQIHEKMVETGLVTPDKLVKWLYKDVLHVDLDDPYLGLGETLFANYPFKEEDARSPNSPR